VVFEQHFPPAVVLADALSEDKATWLVSPGHLAGGRLQPEGVWKPIACYLLFAKIHLESVGLTSGLPMLASKGFLLLL
jgi:hypothetical protein